MSGYYNMSSIARSTSVEDFNLTFRNVLFEMITLNLFLFVALGVMVSQFGFSVG